MCVSCRGFFWICICHKFTTLQNPKQVKYTKKMSDICFLLHLQLDQILISVCFPFILGIPFWDFKILRDDWSCQRLKNLGDLWNLSSTCSGCVCVCARGDLSAWTPWNFYHWFYFILLPILSPFWQHVLSPPLVKSSKRIKHFIPQHTRLSIRSLAWPARLKSKPRPNRKEIRRNPSRKSVKYWKMGFHDPSFGSITDISWFWGIGRTVS